MSFEDVIRRQLDLFAEECADLIADCDAAERAYDAADRDEAEEKYGDYLDLVETGTDDPGRLYGPGVEAGYQFASLGGFTAMVGAGLGYAPGMPDDQSAVGAMLELGLGYTWRR